MTFSFYNNRAIKILFLALLNGSVWGGSKTDSIGHDLFCVYHLKAGGVSGMAHGRVLSLQHKKNEQRIFIINTAINDLDEFRELVKQAAVLKPYGTVQVNIGTLANKSFYEIPKGGNPWNEYASNNAPLYKFFPDPKIVPFVPGDFVRKNRKLLTDKAGILKENGMEAAFFANEPGFLPSAFFDTYPNMRGPRVDHPRRSNFEFFSPCVSVKETQDMYAGMMTEMLKAIPEIKTFFFKTNDAGGGFCWADWLYTGPNGPAQCKNQSMGERVKILMTALQQGASNAGRSVNIYLTRGDSNFSDPEKMDIDKNLPQNCYFIGDNSPGIATIGSFLGTEYPAVGILEPLSFLQNVQSIKKKSASTIFIGLKTFYNRGNESPDVTGILLNILERELKEPVTGGTLTDLQELRKYCGEWAGEKAAEDVFNAFVKLNEAVKYKNAALPRVTAMYWAVSNRYINRPLVIAPQRLTGKEAAYFLPYVFNVSKNEAAMDYTDIHGGHNEIQPGVVDDYVSKIKQVYLLLESIDSTAPKKEFIQNMATALKIYASVMRSCGNFAEAQTIRDRNSAKLNGPVHRPDKTVTWTGDPDFIRFNEIMRDELDNAQELIHLLQKGGMDMVIHAKDSMHEDTFLLGPDLINQVKKKRKIMLDHWRDIEDYMTSPFK